MMKTHLTLFSTPYNTHFFLSPLKLTQTDSLKVYAESTSTPDTGQHLSTNTFHSSQINQDLVLDDSSGRFPVTIPETS